MKNSFLKNSNFILGLILILTFCLQVYKLSSESFWMDEVYTIQTTELPLIDMLKERLERAHSPIYFLMMRPWIDIFGKSEFALRFPSVIFGTLTVCLTFLVGREFFGRRTGLVAAFLVAINAMIIEYAQEARPYTLTVFLVLLSVYFMIRMEKADFKRFKVWFIISILAALYTHAYTAFFFFGLGLYLVFKYFQSEKFNKVLIILSIPLVLYLPYFAAIVVGMVNPTEGSPLFWWQDKELDLGIALRNLFVRSNIAVYFAPRSYLHFIPNAILLFFLFWALKLFFQSKNREEVARLTFLALWLLLPFMIPFLLSCLWRKFFSIHYALFIVPALYIIIAYAIVKFPYNKLKLPKTALLIPLAIVFVFTSVNLKDFYTQYHKPPWRAVNSYLEENFKKGEIVILFEATGESIEAFHFYNPNIPVFWSLFLKPEQVKGKNVFLISFGKLNEQIISEKALEAYNQKLDKVDVIDKIWIYHLIKK